MKMKFFHHYRRLAFMFVIAVLSCRPESAQKQGSEESSPPRKSECSDLTVMECINAKAIINRACEVKGNICVGKSGSEESSPPQKSKCSDLTVVECINAKTIINRACEVKGDKCVDKSVIIPKKDLVAYLKNPVVDPKVEHWAKIGIDRYKTALKASRDNAKNHDAPRGGRSINSWIKDTFNEEEDVILKDLSSADAPPLWDKEAIDKAYNAAVAQKARDITLGKPTFTVVKGLSINYLQDYPWGKDAIVQLASQFNFLESPSANKVKVSSYVTDATQGPQGSIEAAAAALHRYASEDGGTLPHALSQMLPGGHDKYYKNGYLEPSKIALHEQQAVLTKLQDNIQKLLILPQWVLSEPSGSKQLQVFSAAPSYQGAAPPAAGSIGEKLCDLLVTAQYEAIAKLAVILSIAEDKVVPVHLTLVGQGAFQNPQSVMTEAFKKVAEVVQGYPNVRVFIHAFGNIDNQKVVNAQLQSPTWDLIPWSKVQFKNAAP